MNSIKTFMNKVGEKVREVTPQSSSSIIDGTDPRELELEGFVCPTCFERLSTPELLEKHYSDVHLDPSANYLCPVCKARLNSQSELEMHYAANHDDKGFNNHSIETLREELIEMSTNLREERWYSEELKKEVSRLQEAFKKKDDDDTDSEAYVHMAQLVAVEESKSLLSSEVVLLRKQLSESLSQCSSMRSEKDNLEQRASEFAVERAELRATLDVLQAEKAGLEQQLEDINSTSARMEATRKGQIENITSEVARLEGLLGSRDKDIQCSKDREVALQQDLKMKSETSAEIKEEMRNLKMDFDLMKIKLQEKSDQAMHFQTKLKQREMDIQELSEKMSTMETTQSNHMEMNYANEAAVEDPAVSDDATERMKQEIEMYKEQLRSKASEIETLKSRVDDAERSQSHAEELAREKLKLIDDIKDSKYDVQKTLENVKNKMSDAIQDLRDKDRTIDMLNTKVEEIFDLRRLVETDKEKMISIQHELKKEKQNSNDLQGLVDKNRQEISTLKEQKQRIEAEMEKVKAQMKLNLLATEEQQDEANTNIYILAQKTKETDDLRTQLLSLSSNEENLKEKLNLNYSEIKELKSSIEFLKVDKLSLEKEIETVSIRQLEAQKSLTSELNLKTELQRNLSESQNKLEHLTITSTQLSMNFEDELMKTENQVLTLINERDQLAIDVRKLVDVRSEIESEKDTLVDEIAALNSKLLESNNVHKTLTKKITDSEVKIANALEKNQQTFKEILLHKEKIISLENNAKAQKSRSLELEECFSNQEAEMAGLAGDKLELEVKLEASMEEQQGLLERCVVAETEVERLQQQLTQLRRKFVDSTAGLHELGRENQSLQMELAKLSGRIWTEDSEVSNCAHCEKTFSMTLRKHHCRNCYQIFCNDCSSKLASLDQSKKPVRVCDSCHAEVITRA